MNTIVTSISPKRRLPDLDKVFDAVGAWVLAIVWISPLLFATWAALQPSGTALGMDFSNPLTFENFVYVWNAVPWVGYFTNTVVLVTLILAGQLVLCTLAGFAFARFEFKGRDTVFILSLIHI